MECPKLKELETECKIARRSWEHFYGSENQTRSWKKLTQQARDMYDEAMKRIETHPRNCEACKK